jgi:hypothetical protein
MNILNRMPLRNHGSAIDLSSLLSKRSVPNSVDLKKKPLCEIDAQVPNHILDTQGSTCKFGLDWIKWNNYMQRVHIQQCRRPGPLLVVLVR